MKKPRGNFLSIGCGSHQIPLLLAARKRGMRLIGVDRISDAPGFSLCDIRIIESTKEYRKILLGLSKVLLIEPLLGVATRSFGDAVYTTAYLASKYKLVGNSPESVSLFLSKKKIKSLLERRQIPVPSSVSLSFEKKAKGKSKPSIPNFPIIAKPSQGSGKSGIRWIQTEKDFLQFSKSSLAETTLVEEFIQGEEVTVLGMVVSGNFHLISLTDKVTTEFPPFLEIAHIAPSKHLGLSGELKMLCQSIVNASGLTNGAFLAEFKITDKKECYLMEAAPEVGGEYLADYLLPEFYGYDYFEDLMGLYLGEKISPKLLLRPKKQLQSSAIVFQIPPQGKSTVPEYFPFVANPEEQVFFAKDFHPPGTKLNTDVGNSQRIRVVGISTKSQNLSRKEWLSSIQVRLQKES